MNWNWSFRAFRLFDVDVRIHWSLPAFFIYYLLRGAELGYSPTTFSLFVVLPMLLLFASVVAHEYGHVFAARHYMLGVDHMILTPIGGMVMVAQGRTPKHELVVAIAGPMVNLALAVIAAVLYLALGGPASPTMFLPFFGNAAFIELWRSGAIVQMVIYDFVQMQVGLFLFNMLLAAYPMDGGRVLMSILWKRRGYHRALIASCKVARVLAVLMGIAGIVTGGAGLVLIAFLVFFQAQMTLRQVDLMPDPGRGYDPGFMRSQRQQAEMRKKAKAKKKQPWFFERWMRERRERRIRALLARVETDGIGSLTNPEREWLKRAREMR